MKGITNTMKIDDILKELTLKEKIGMIHGDGLFQTKGVPRLGIPPLKMADGPMGVRADFQNDQWISLNQEDDYVSYLPSGSAIAASWNQEVAYDMGKVLGEEARGRGKDVILAPSVNIKRSPLCGRNFEYMSEDPYLTAKLATDMIKGIQESDVAACVKHFAMNNQETMRLWVDVKVEERAVRELYLPAFKAAVEAGTLSLMGAYNRYKGFHCCHNKELLDDILRTEWGYQGTVISDWGAVHDTALAANCSLDIEMSVTDNFDEYFMADPLYEAVQNGTIKESVVDEKVKRVLWMMDHLQMLGGNRKSGSYNTQQHRQRIKEAAKESVVLLKNENHNLPWAKASVTRILVIGDNGTRLHSTGGGSAEIKALYEISPLMGLKMLLGGHVEITYAKGYYVPEEKESETNWQESSLEESSNVHAQKKDSFDVSKKQEELRKEALELAKDFEHIIYVGGLNHDFDVEGLDREDLTLPYGQDQLLEELLLIHPRTIVTLITGAPVSMEQWESKAQTILWMSYAGMEGGSVFAETIFGDNNPSGKLPETWTKTLADCPAHSVGEFPGAESVAYTEGLYVGYRYHEKYNVKPQYPFGHGLSYTTFRYDSIEVEQFYEEQEIKVTVNVKITNNGTVDGKEVIQLYVEPKNPQIDRPIQELKGFAKVALEAGETKEVTLTLDASSFAYYSEAKKQFVVDTGVYNLRVGTSSGDIRLEKEIRILNK